MTHEFGHALGLNHSATEDFGNLPLGNPGFSGALTDYGEPFSVMGNATAVYNGQLAGGQYTAEHKIHELGWLTRSDYQQVQSSGTFTLAPLESSSGLRALNILRDPVSGSSLWLEYRQPIGDVDSSLALIQQYGGGTNVFSGALIHFEDPTVEATYYDQTFLLDFNPIRSASFIPRNLTVAPGFCRMGSFEKRSKRPSAARRYQCVRLR